MKPLLLAIFFATRLTALSTPEYSIQAILLANSPGDAVASLVMGAPQNEKVDTVYALWLIRGGGRNILFDSGFHRARWFKAWTIKDYLRPDEAVRLAGVSTDNITDVVISHAHWDHMGGIDLFPKAIIWIQKEEFRYYTGAAWQPGGDHGGVDPEDVQQLVRLNTEGRLRLVEPGIPSRRSISKSLAIRHSYWPQIVFTFIAISPSTNRVRRSARQIMQQILRIRNVWSRWRVLALASCLVMMLSNSRSSLLKDASPQ